MIIMAIDLGKFNSMACIYDNQTQEQQFETVSTERGFFKTLFKTWSLLKPVARAAG